MQQDCLTSLVNPNFKFHLPKETTPFTPITLKSLILNFQRRLSDRGIPLATLKLTGSSVTKGLSLQTDDLKDLDFLGHIPSPVSAFEVKEIFLEVLAETLGICRQSVLGGAEYSFSRKGRPLGQLKALVPDPTKPVETTVPNLFEHFSGKRLLEALEFQNGFFFVTLPFWIGDKKRSIDIRIEFGDQTGPCCLTSADCFQYEMLPYFLEDKKAEALTAPEGYHAVESLDLFERGLFSMREDWIPQLRDGLRGYAGKPTKKLAPIHFRYESALIQAWKKERATFFPDLKKYIFRHFGQSPHSANPAAIAYLINLRTVFSSASLIDLRDRDLFLEMFDAEFFKNLLPQPEVHPSDEDRKEPLAADPALLRALCFWSHLEDPVKSRRDCPDKIHQTRFFVPFGSGYIFAPPPWKETMELLLGDKRNLEPLLGHLGFPDTIDQLWNHLGKLFEEMAPIDPRAPLFQWFLSNDSTLDTLIPLLLAALPRLSDEDRALIQKMLLRRGFDTIANCIDLSPKPHTPLSFIKTLLENNIPPEVLFEPMRALCQQGDSFESLKSRLEIAQLFQARERALCEIISIRLPQIAPHDPRTPLFQWLASKDTKMERFTHLFISALPHLNESDRAVMNQILENRGMSKLAACVRETPAAVHPLIFLKKLLEKGVKLEALLEAAKEGVLQAASLDELQLALEMNLQFNDRQLNAIVEEQIWEKGDPASEIQIDFYLQNPERSTSYLIDHLHLIRKPADQKKGERWLQFWIKELTFHPNLIKSLIQSDHFSENEELSLIQAAMKNAAAKEDYSTFFFCFGLSARKPDFSIKSLELLQQIGKKKNLDPAVAIQALRSISELTDLEYDKSALMKLLLNLPIASWLNLTEAPLLCWKIVSRLSNRPAAIPECSQTEMTRILEVLFNSLNRRDFMALFLEFTTGDRIEIAREMAYLARCVRRDPLFPTSEASTMEEILLPFAKNPDWAPTLTSLLLEPRFAQTGQELLTRLGVQMKMDQIREEDLSSLLSSDFHFLPPVEIRKILVKALLSLQTTSQVNIPELLKRIPEGILLDPEVQGAIGQYLSAQRKIEFPALKDLVNLGAADSSQIWDLAIKMHPLNKKTASSLLELSLLCLQKSGKGIPAIESYWLSRLNLPALSSVQALKMLHDLPRLTDSFQKQVLTKLTAHDRITQELSTLFSQANESSPPSYIYKIALKGLDAKLYEQTFEFLLKSKKQFSQMEPLELASLLEKLTEGKIESALLCPLVQIALDRISSQKNPEDNLQALSIDLFSEESMNEFNPQHSELFLQNMTLLSQGSLLKVWTVLKPIFQNKRFPFKNLELKALSLMQEKIRAEKDDPKTVGILREFIQWFPYTETSSGQLDLFEMVAASQGNSIYRHPDAARSLEIICDQFLSRPSNWAEEDPRLLVSFLERFSAHFQKFQNQKQQIKSDVLIRIAQKMEAAMAPGKGLEILIDTLRDLSQAPTVAESKETKQAAPSAASSKNKKSSSTAASASSSPPSTPHSETLGAYWMNLWIELGTFHSRRIESFESMFHLLQAALVNKVISQEQWMNCYLAMQHQILNCTIELGSQPSEREIASIRSLHALMMKMYPWMIEPKRRDLTVSRPFDSAPSRTEKGYEITNVCFITHLWFLTQASRIANFSDEVQGLIQFMSLRELVPNPNLPSSKPKILFKLHHLRSFLKEYTPFILNSNDPIPSFYLCIQLIQNLDLDSAGSFQQSNVEKMAAIATFTEVVCDQFLLNEKGHLTANDILNVAIGRAAGTVLFPNIAKLAARIASALLSDKDNEGLCTRFENALENMEYIAQFLDKYKTLDPSQVRSLLESVGPCIEEFRLAASLFIKKKGEKVYYKETIQKTLKVIATFKSHMGK